MNALNALIASMIGLGPHDMSGWDWVLATLMMLLLAAIAVAAGYNAVRVTRNAR